MLLEALLLGEILLLGLTEALGDIELLCELLGLTEEEGEADKLTLLEGLTLALGLIEGDILGLPVKEGLGLALLLILLLLYPSYIALIPFKYLTNGRVMLYNVHIPFVVEER